MAGYFVAFPDTLPPENGQIVVDLQGNAAQTDRSQLALFNGTSRVPLQVIDTSKGGYDRTQLVLSPTQRLSRGKWRLLVDPRTTHTELWNGEQVWTSSPGPSRWVVGPPTGTPRWASPPRFIGVTERKFGCGDAVEAQIQVGKKLSGEWVAVRLTRDENVQQARVQVNDEGILTIGHGMCGGRFAMQIGPHVAELTLLGQDGPSAATVHQVVFEVR
jgi:hypothetical protein